jgi:hypothetical protein
VDQTETKQKLMSGQTNSAKVRKNIYRYTWCLKFYRLYVGSLRTIEIRVERGPPRNTTNAILDIKLLLHGYDIF